MKIAVAYGSPIQISSLDYEFYDCKNNNILSQQLVNPHARKLTSRRCTKLITITNGQFDGKIPAFVILDYKNQLAEIAFPQLDLHRYLKYIYPLPCATNSSGHS